MRPLALTSAIPVATSTAEVRVEKVPSPTCPHPLAPQPYSLPPHDRTKWCRPEVATCAAPSGGDRVLQAGSPGTTTGNSAIRTLTTPCWSMKTPVSRYPALSTMPSVPNPIGSQAFPAVQTKASPYVVVARPPSRSAFTDWKWGWQVTPTESTCPAWTVPLPPVTSQRVHAGWLATPTEYGAPSTSQPRNANGRGEVAGTSQGARGYQLGHRG